ncbi:MAG: molybdenum cofactor guanylyltransferase [Acidimicrobiia bacterium]|nr:molybdenum cofactor guanylyltransferase [Acidimicrobiia bacterium]
MLSAAILIGGRATRYGGHDKGALVIGGRTIRDRQVEVLSLVSDDVSIVGGDTPVANDLPAHVRWVPDEHPGLGPLAGIEAALRAARHDLVAIVACDMPGLTSAFLTQLVALTGQTDVDVVVPKTEQRYHPLCAVYRAPTCLPVVAERLAEGQLAVKALFARLRLREVTGAELAAMGDPQRLLANINTPADHEMLTSHLAHDT